MSNKLFIYNVDNF